MIRRVNVNTKTPEKASGGQRISGQNFTFSLPFLYQILIFAVCSTQRRKGAEVAAPPAVRAALAMV
jgi:hypothetical protein